MRAEIIRRRGYPPDIAGDELALSMSSYPQTAAYLAVRLKGHGEIVCELCCGIGVSMIELAKVFKHVVGVDNNSSILADCRSNLRAAGISNYTLIEADVSQPYVLDELQADIVLYAIPYWDTYDDTKRLLSKNPDMVRLINSIRRHTSNNIVIYAPPDMTYTMAFGLLGPCEFNMIYIDGKLDRNIIFLGDLMRQSARSVTHLSAKPTFPSSES